MKKMQLSGSIKYSQIDESQRAFLGNIKGEMVSPGTASGAQTSKYTGEGTRRKPWLVWKVLSSTSLHILSPFHSQGYKLAQISTCWWFWKQRSHQLFSPGLLKASSRTAGQGKSVRILGNLLVLEAPSAEEVNGKKQKTLLDGLEESLRSCCRQGAPLSQGHADAAFPIRAQEMLFSLVSAAGNQEEQCLMLQCLGV